MTSRLLQAPTGVQVCSSRRTSFQAVHTTHTATQLRAPASVHFRSGAYRLAGKQLQLTAARQSRSRNAKQHAILPRCQAAPQKKTVAITGKAAAVWQLARDAIVRCHMGQTFRRCDWPYRQQTGGQAVLTRAYSQSADQECQ